MIATMASSDPVKFYYDSLERLHLRIRQNTPFTYLAYKSMIPAKEDDFIGLAYKISCYISFRFFIQIGAHMMSPGFGLIPFFPLILDFIWVGVRWIRDSNADSVSSEAPSLIMTLLFLNVAFFAMHFLDKALLNNNVYHYVA